MFKARRLFLFSLILSGLVGTQAFSPAQSADSGAAAVAGKKAAHDRHENFEDMGTAFEKLEKESKKRSPDPALVKGYVTQIATLGKESTNWFPPGSGPGNGFKTKALAEVWSQPDAFQALQEKFLAEAEKLSQLAPGADNAKLIAQVTATGEACSECHKKFRKESGLFSIFGG